MSRALLHKRRSQPSPKSKSHQETGAENAGENAIPSAPPKSVAAHGSDPKDGWKWLKTIWNDLWKSLKTDWFRAVCVSQFLFGVALIGAGAVLLHMNPQTDFWAIAHANVLLCILWLVAWLFLCIVLARKNDFWRPVYTGSLYFLALLVGAAVIVIVAVTIHGKWPLSFADFGSYIQANTPLLAVWTAMIASLWIALGNNKNPTQEELKTGSYPYWELIRPYRSLWICFIFVLLALTLTMRELWHSVVISKSPPFAGTFIQAAPFLLLALLYAALLLLPWLILFMFLVRKSDSLVQEKVNTLSDTELARQFMQSSPSPEARAIAQDMKKDDPTFIDEVRSRAFRISEFVINLLLLSSLLVVLLSISFFPTGVAGLTTWVRGDATLQALIGDFATNSTAITFGFLGAYFFVIQMFLRRYFAGDLTPKAYAYASVRVLTILILSFGLELAARSLNSQKPGYVWVAAFAIGIFPMESLRAGLRWIQEKWNFLGPTRGLNECPLPTLDGLNTWQEARLLEEKVESIQNLAMAPLEDLIVHTNFASFQLLDWVDQAILYVHAQHYWYPVLAATGIRGATDLIENTCLHGKNEPDDAEITKLAGAVKATFKILPKAKTENDKPELEVEVIKDALRVFARAVAPEPNVSSQ